LKEVLLLGCKQVKELQKTVKQFETAFENIKKSARGALVTYLTHLKENLNDLLDTAKNRDFNIKEEIRAQTVSYATTLLFLTSSTPPTSPIERNPIKLREEAAALRERIESLRAWLTDNPPGTSVERGNRLSTDALADLQDQMNDLNYGIACMLIREDPVINEDIQPDKRVKFDCPPGLNQTQLNQQLISELHELNGSLHRLNGLIVSQYPGVTDAPGGQKRLGLAASLAALNPKNPKNGNPLSFEERLDWLERFEASTFLKIMHAHGYLRLRALENRREQLKFTFETPATKQDRQIIATTPPKASYEWQTTLTAIALPTLAYVCSTVGLPNFTWPILALQLPIAWITFERFKAGIRAQFTEYIGRQAEGNAASPEDILANSLRVVKSTSRISYKIGLFDFLLAGSRDSDDAKVATAKVNNPFFALVEQAIKAVELTINNYDKLAATSTTESANARRLVEDALQLVKKHEDSTVKAWQRGIIWPLMPMVGLGAIGALQTVPLIYSIIARLF
jgi:hypothetical protein